jgi:UDPglucose 6-dehydrogenase
LNYVARKLNCESDIAKATDYLNDNLTYDIANKIESATIPFGTIAILGLAFKPLSGIIEESQSISLAEILYDKQFQVVGYDPLANDAAKERLKQKIFITDSIEECIANADTVVIATPDSNFLNIEPSFFGNRNVVIYDCWRLLRKKLENQPNITYLALGLYNG